MSHDQAGQEHENHAGWRILSLPTESLSEIELKDFASDRDSHFLSANKSIILVFQISEEEECECSIRATYPCTRRTVTVVSMYQAMQMNA